MYSVSKALLSFPTLFKYSSQLDEGAWETLLRAQASLALMPLAIPEVWNLRDQDPFPSQLWAGPLPVETVAIPTQGGISVPEVQSQG